MSPTTALALSVKGLSKTYRTKGGEFKAIELFECDVQQGEFVSIIGPSGAGKTTLLRCLAGLMTPTSGAISIKGRTISGPPRAMALVFQDYSRSLLPWMTAAGNVALPLKNKGFTRIERERIASEALHAVGLAGAEARYPWQLSGGMQQRVAIARALAFKPQILLMDEPFASVDAQTRAELEDLVLRVREEFNITVIVVTHDIDEAIYLSDRVIVLTHSPSRIRDVVAVDLPSPRDQAMTKELTEFGHLRTRILREIRVAPPA